MQNEKEMPSKKLWFKAKRYGWGWTPVTWEGWAVTFIWILGIIKIAKDADKNSHSASDTILKAIIPFIIISVLLMIICYLKGEKPRWRWGND
jgi:hypothetical protein